MPVKKTYRQQTIPRMLARREMQHTRRTRQICLGCRQPEPSVQQRELKQLQRERQQLQQQVAQWTKETQEEMVEWLGQKLRQLSLEERERGWYLGVESWYPKFQLARSWSHLREVQRTVESLRLLSLEPVKQPKRTIRIQHEETLVHHLLDRQLGKKPKYLTNQPKCGLLAQVPATLTIQQKDYTEDLATPPPS